MINKFSIVAFSLLVSASALQAGGGPPSEDDCGCVCIARPAKGQELKLVKNPLSDEPIQFDPSAPLELMNKKMVPGYIGHPFGRNVVTQHNGKLTVTTDHNTSYSYQLETKRFLVKEGDIVNIKYKIKVHPGGKVGVGLLKTDRVWWYNGQPSVFTGGSDHLAAVYKDDYDIIVPKGENMASLVLLNYHVEKPGASTFTIKRLKMTITPAS